MMTYRLALVAAALVSADAFVMPAVTSTPSTKPAPRMAIELAPAAEAAIAAASVLGLVVVGGTASLLMSSAEFTLPIAKRLNDLSENMNDLAVQEGLLHLPPGCR